MRSGKVQERPANPEMRYRLVCFDLDGTLVDELTYIWPLVHESLGIDQEKVKEAAGRFYAGEITFREWAEHDVSLWIEKGVTRKDLLGVAGKLSMMKGAEETLKILKERGYKLAVISGGLDIILDHFFPDPKKTFDHVMINRLLFDAKGNVTSIEPTEFGADSYKISGLEEIAKKEGISVKECVFVGDSDNDLDIARGAGLSIGFNPHEKLALVCDRIVRKKDLGEVLKHIP